MNDLIESAIKNIATLKELAHKKGLDAKNALNCAIQHRSGSYTDDLKSLLRQVDFSSDIIQAALLGIKSKLQQALNEGNNATNNKVPPEHDAAPLESAVESASRQLMDDIAEVGRRVSKVSRAAHCVSSDLIDCVHELEELTGREFEAETKDCRHV